MKLICIIPARYNSKRLKNKNFTKIGRKLLVEYTLAFSQKIKEFDKIVFSSDAVKYFYLKNKYKKIDFLRRPKKISSDTTPMSSVIKHVISEYKSKGLEFDAVVILQPTSPLRKVETIKKSILKFKKLRPNYLASISKLNHKYFPKMILKLTRLNKTYKKNINISNKKENFYRLDGGVIFIFNKLNKSYKLEGNGVFVETKYPENLDIDTFDEFLQFKNFLR